jgi:heterodisulfide reductase subunit B
MKQYTFYPGCAYDSSGLPIRLSIESTNPLLDIELIELDDWTCCGCPGASISELGGLAVATRNLALAENWEETWCPHAAVVIEICSTLI